MEKIHSYSLDAILDSSHETTIVKDVRRDIDAALVSAVKLSFIFCLFFMKLSFHSFTKMIIRS